MTDQVTPYSSPLPYAGAHLPAIIEHAGDKAKRRFIEFFTANISNVNTRQAYARAVAQFMAWCEGHGLTLESIEPVHVAAYRETRGQSAATIKQHLAAIRHLFDYLVVGQVIPFNPASSVRGPKLVRAQGKTPILEPEDARALFDAIDLSRISGLRDRAIIGVMLYSFARVSAVINLKVGDYYSMGKQWSLHLNEKGGKERDLPVHHLAEQYLDAYLAGAGIEEDKKAPLFRTIDRTTKALSDRPMLRTDVTKMVKRRARLAGLAPEKVCSHSWRGTGITLFLDNGGELEKAKQIAGHSSIETTQLYDRRNRSIERAEIERIRL